MTQNKLGLPIEYFKFPEFFDEHNIFSDTDIKNAVIANLLREYEAQTVLDMTCGTGSQVFFLKERGYKIIGSDFSAPLIDIARKRAIEKNLDIEFVTGDVREIKLGIFDSVITIFNSIGHLTKPDFNIALQNIRHNLKKDGIYIFDIINPKILTDEILENGIERKVMNEQINNSQRYKFDGKSNIITCYEDVRIQKAKLGAKKFKNKFSLQLYEADELKDVLKQNGFEILKQYDTFGEKFEEYYSLNILNVARRKE